LLVVIFDVSLLIIFEAQFDLFMTSSPVAVTRCMFVIPATDIGVVLDPFFRV
jgi:hypothetical protein